MSHALYTITIHLSAPSHSSHPSVLHVMQRLTDVQGASNKWALNPKHDMSVTPSKAQGILQKVWEERIKEARDKEATKCYHQDMIHLCKHKPTGATVAHTGSEQDKAYRQPIMGRVGALRFCNWWILEEGQSFSPTLWQTVSLRASVNNSKPMAIQIDDSG